MNDSYGTPFTIVFDEAYKKLCPWASVPEPKAEESWTKEMTDAVVEGLESEKDNREQRREKKKKGH